MRNFGFDVSKQKADEKPGIDWVFGAVQVSGLTDVVAGLDVAGYAWSTPVKGIYPRTLNQINHVFCLYNPDYLKYFSAGEVQRGREDMMDCTSRGRNEDEEKHLNYAYQNNLFSTKTKHFLEDNGFVNADGLIELSDAYHAILSGTTRQGNSIIAPHEARRKHGIVPKKLLPFEVGMTWEQYHNPKRITKAISDLGKLSLEYISYNYVEVPLKDFPRFAGSIRYMARDSYIDPVDGDFEKRLAENYNFYPKAYQMFINDLKKNEEIINPINDTMPQFVKASKNDNPSRVYQVCADGKKRWIDQPLFNKMYGDISKITVTDVQVLAPEDIGDEIIENSAATQTFFYRLLKPFFGFLKGRK